MSAVYTIVMTSAVTISGANIFPAFEARWPRTTEGIKRWWVKDHRNGDLVAQPQHSPETQPLVGGSEWQNLLKLTLAFESSGVCQNLSYYEYFTCSLMTSVNAIQIENTVLCSTMMKTYA